ncbi:carotenoid biosynthesis protein [Robertkochia sediminum]|uniref:carotenoid biosynthesis protein n=1 Tax=Robertkochia sediminum TaxID=2785326 RepID=UPI001931425F|nr:carotenoid biosynthesis protein [Robertkochia sediminum]MBL7472524.1 carotenoid biosynthesis protein [Robertkochia sediminum]
MNTMNTPLKTFSKATIAIFTVWLFHISALIGSLLFDQTSWFITKTPLNLLLCLFLLVWVFPIRRQKEILLFGTLFLAGMLAEITGVQTGILFGDYAYGENLGPKFYGVPYTIGINWAVLSFITGCIANTWISFPVLRVIGGVALMLLLDVLLEGIAPPFDFWEFSGGDAPLFNYICWGLLALLMQIAYNYLKIKGNYRFSLHLFLAQACFFLVFYLWLHF